MQRVILIATMITLLWSAAFSTESPETRVDVAQVIAQSRQLTLRGQWDTAISKLQTELGKATGSRDIRAESLLRTEYARVLVDRNFFHHDDRGAAEGALNAAETTARRSNDSLSSADVIQYRGQMRYKDSFDDNNWEAPRKLFERALALREKLGEKSRQAESNFYLGLTYDQQKLPAQAMPLYRKAQRLSESSGDKVMQSYAHRHIGGLEEEAGHFDSAYEHIVRSLQLRREAEFTVGVPFAMLQLAEFLSARRNERARALALAKEALTAAEAANSPRARESAQQLIAQLEKEK